MVEALGFSDGMWVPTNVRCLVCGWFEVVDNVERRCIFSGLWMRVRGLLVSVDMLKQYPIRELVRFSCHGYSSASLFEILKVWPINPYNFFVGFVCWSRILVGF